MSGGNGWERESAPRKYVLTVALVDEESGVPIHYRQIPTIATSAAEAKMLIGLALDQEEQRIGEVLDLLHQHGASEGERERETK